jgi:hypothetical protein
MPASLYNLVNRKHHSEVESVVAENPVPELQAQNDVQVVDVPALVVVEPAVVEIDKVETQEQPVAEAKVSFPNWDVSWSKYQLLAVAQSLNLSVTSVSTKTEIVNVLTAAAKAW